MLAGVPLAWGSAWIAYQAVRVLGGIGASRRGSFPATGWCARDLTPGSGIRSTRRCSASSCGTGVSLTPLPVLLVAVGVYLLGTRLRTRSEERLLRRQFGDEYVRYVREVVGSRSVAGAYFSSLIEMFRNCTRRRARPDAVLLAAVVLERERPRAGMPGSSAFSITVLAVQHDRQPVALHGDLERVPLADGPVGLAASASRPARTSGGIFSSVR